jgi:hypothetical protein
VRILNLVAFPTNAVGSPMTFDVNVKGLFFTVQKTLPGVSRTCGNRSGKTRRRCRSLPRGDRFDTPSGARFGLSKRQAPTIEVGDGRRGNGLRESGMNCPRDISAMAGVFPA